MSSRADQEHPLKRCRLRVAQAFRPAQPRQTYKVCATSQPKLLCARQPAAGLVPASLPWDEVAGTCHRLIG